MPGFEKIMLKSGEGRTDYIRRRLGEGASPAEIHAEINSPALFNGAPGKAWAINLVYGEKSRLDRKKEPAPAKTRVAAPKAEAQPGVPSPVAATVEAMPREELRAAATAAVPPEYEGILTSEDVAAVREEAARRVKEEQRKKARESLLAQTRADLARLAREEQQRGAARGDLVDISIDLAPYAPHLTIDGQVFWHGQTYRVARNVAKVLQEQMQRSWHHQDEISGQKNDFFRQRNISINGSTGVVSGAEGLRA